MEVSFEHEDDLQLGETWNVELRVTGDPADGEGFDLDQVLVEEPDQNAGVGVDGVVSDSPEALATLATP